MGGAERKKAAAATEEQAFIARKQAGLAENLYRESAPLRRLATGYYKDIAKGGDTLTTAIAPQINRTTREYQSALKKVRGMPLGGARDRAMRELILGEAQTKAGIRSGAQQEAINRLGTMGESGLTTSITGYSQAGAGLGQAAQAYSQMAAEKANMWGQGGGAAGQAGAAAIAA